MRSFLQNCSQHIRDWYVDACAQRCAIVVNQHHIVTVVFWHIRFLVLLQANQNAFLFLAFNGHQHTVTDEPHTLFVVHMNDARRFTLGHRTFADFRIVHHTQAGKLSNLIAHGRCVNLMAVDEAGLTDNRR